ncbi:hypothetical protein [Amycolatopsis sp. DSM 110486]|uniref:hypothetical protein n=1 Tax=Amycolatopsis sp. DSM 110486 TaxID=2865832 RepID=UPI001C6A5251|nr:hypothetical protein [Amycolatopsis sp. DSM 110486]QYN17509.1 hypothetical protein K1T34_32505 [Amycolatopsis sp. DSM 110486]
MIRYVLQGKESMIHSEWKLTAHTPGEEPKVWREQNLTVSEALEWADSCVGPYVELDWKSADGSALSLKWTAEQLEMGEDDDVEVLT